MTDAPLRWFEVWFTSPSRPRVQYGRREGRFLAGVLAEDLARLGADAEVVDPATGEVVERFPAPRSEAA